MKIAFFERQLCERGTTVAVFDYAYHNIHLLNNESIIIYLNNPPQEKNSPEVLEKYSNHFKLYGIDNINDIDTIIKNEKCDVFYQLALDAKSHIHTKCCKNVIHTVFDCKDVRSFFDKMATISKDVHNWNENIPIVPHMINLPRHTDNMRNELGIPENATIFGRYGGKTEFNLSYVHNNIITVAKKRPDIYFLFVNTNNFLDNNAKKLNLENIIFLPSIIDLKKKVKFINTCDAMIHGRQCGESYGLSIGEFNIFNKPIITTISKRHNAHISILGKKGLYYPNAYGDTKLDEQLPNKPEKLYNILMNFNRDEAKNSDWNAYNEYTPKNVMEQFNSIFLKPYLEETDKNFTKI
jgi:hypothetical protein